MTSGDAAELLLGDDLLRLDGPVLEHFRRGATETVRIHVRFLAVHGREPDRKGRVRYHFSPGDAPAGGFRIDVAPEHRDEAEAFLDRVAAAKRAAGGEIVTG
jgi:hypothetical protein